MADTEINEATPGTNYGSGVACAVNGEAPGVGERSCLFRWDASSISPLALVLSATLHVSVLSLPGSESAQDYPVHELKSPWSHTSATWSARFSFWLWQMAGAQGSNDRGFAAARPRLEVTVSTPGSGGSARAPAPVSAARAPATEPARTIGSRRAPKRRT